MKKISVMVPCYNEAENVVPLSEAIIAQFTEHLPQYEYELVFIDNCSTDGTRDLLRELCAGNPNIKAIFNAKNFGQFNSPFHGMLQTTGDCTIGMCADFQDPPEMIPKLVHEWEQGYMIINAVKKTSRENPVMRLFRTVYYKLLKKMSNVNIIEHFTGFGLYDRSFLEVLRELHDPIPFWRGVVSELGYRMKEIPYEQQKRRAGKSHNNFFSLYDAAMLSFTSYTKTGMRVATFFGFIISAISLLIALVYLILKLVNWDNFQMGNAPILIGVFVLGGIQLFFIGLLGEYIMSINTRMMNRPLVIEEERINFDRAEKEEQST